MLKLWYNLIPNKCFIWRIKLKFKNIGNFAVLTLCVLLFSGCSGANFFDVQSAMSAPALTKTQEEIKKAVVNHMGPDVIWKYAKYGEAYSTVINCKISEEDEVYLAFCQHSEETKKIHILFLKNKNDKWVILKDAVQMLLDTKKVSLEDIDGDGTKEIVILDQSTENSYNSVYAYKCLKDKVLDMKIQNNFFDSMDR